MALAIGLLHSLTQSSYKRQEVDRSKPKGFSDACDRVIVIVIAIASQNH